MKSILLATVLLLTGGTSAMAQDKPEDKAQLEVSENNLGRAVFAAGCFWCIEPTFDNMDGVLETIVGYTAGHTENPTYKEVGAGGTGHTEAILVIYDKRKVTYPELIGQFWLNVDPFDGDGQFVDRGPMYRPGVYYFDEEQKQVAEKTAKEVAAKHDQPVRVEIEEAGAFWPAEDYHQDYYTKNPLRYKYYRYGSGRDKRLKAIWGEEADK